MDDDLAASLTFLDDVLDEPSDVASVSNVSMREARAVLSPCVLDNADLEQLLKFVDDIGDGAVSSRSLALQTATEVAPTEMTHIVRHEQAPPAAQTVIIPRNLPNKKKKLNYDPNKARNERRYEIAFLKKEATDLEVMLQQLQNVKFRKTVGLADQLALSSAAVRRPPLWEGICARQLERRLKVERENIHLKMVYSSQLQVAKSLERLLRKRVTLQDVAYSETGMHTRRVPVPMEHSASDETQLFEDLLAGVDSLFLEIEDVFDTNEAVQSNTSTVQPLQRDGVDGRSMELFDNKIMPFNMHATGDAWWRRWHNYKGQATTDSGGNTIIETFGLEMSDVKTNTSATFCVQQLLRRHVESNRIVIVWQARIVPVQFEKKHVDGVQFLEKGYVLIKPHHDGSSYCGDSRVDSSRVLTCYVITPILSNAKARKDVRMAALSRFVMNATSANISTSIEMVENLLVDQALRECRHG